MSISSPPWLLRATFDALPADGSVATLSSIVGALLRARRSLTGYSTADTLASLVADGRAYALDGGWCRGLADGWRWADWGDADGDALVSDRQTMLAFACADGRVVVHPPTGEPSLTFKADPPTRESARRAVLLACWERGLFGDAPAPAGDPVAATPACPACASEKSSGRTFVDHTCRLGLRIRAGHGDGQAPRALAPAGASALFRAFCSAVNTDEHGMALDHVPAAERVERTRRLCDEAAADIEARAVRKALDQIDERVGRGMRDAVDEIRELKAGSEDAPDLRDVEIARFQRELSRANDRHADDQRELSRLRTIETAAARFAGAHRAAEKARGASLGMGLQGAELVDDAARDRSAARDALCDLFPLTTPPTSPTGDP